MDRRISSRSSSITAVSIADHSDCPAIPTTSFHDRYTIPILTSSILDWLEVPQRVNFLDLGCGNGDYLRAFQDRKCDGAGVGVSKDVPQMLQLAPRSDLHISCLQNGAGRVFRYQGLVFYQTDISNLAQATQAKLLEDTRDAGGEVHGYNYIVNLNFETEIPPYQQGMFLSKWSKLLAPDGKIVLGTPLEKARSLTQRDPTFSFVSYMNDFPTTKISFNSVAVFQGPGKGTATLSSYLGLALPTLHVLPPLTNNDVEILHSIVVEAHASRGAPLHALLTAYNYVLPAYGADPDPDHVLFLFLLRFGKDLTDMSALYERFLIVLERMGIRIEVIEVY